ncbi:putative O-linked N-acetylglucosamine transferase, SPINDLY family protein (plasmid) [Rickettsiales bacterium Ac37b]|nr:putative O-linked N-acetylglucosamine transferase, SPINDLY family protein [Rickettsiales bacterium Ac37b]
MVSMKELKGLSEEVRSKEYEDTADALYEAGNYLEAIEEYRKSIELDPSYAENYYKVGKCYYKVANYKEAIREYTSAINLCPLEEEYYYSRALCYLEIKEYNLVIEDITEAIEVSREVDVKYYIIKAEAYSKLYKYEEAKRYYDIAIYNEYTNEDHYVSRGDYYHKIGNHEKAIKDYSKAVYLDSRDSENYYKRAVSHVSLGNYLEALEDMNKAIELLPKAEVHKIQLKRPLKKRKSRTPKTVCRVIGFNQETQKDNTIIQMIKKYYSHRSVIYRYLDRSEEALKDLNKLTELESIK